MKKVVIQTPDSEPNVFDAGVVTIGRAESNMLVVRDARVSSLHGEVVRRGTAFFFRDLGSTNGSMVRRAGAPEVVVDGRRTRETEIRDGDELLLGDDESPVVLLVQVIEDSADPRRPTTVTCRTIASVDVLGTQIVENPLASRQTLSRLFQFYGELAHAGSAKHLTDLTADFLLRLLSKTRFAAVYLCPQGRLERSTLVAKDGQVVPVLEGERIESLFPDAVGGRASMIVPGSLIEELGGTGIEAVAAVPVPSGDGVLGVALLGRAAALSDFDLDLMGLVAHHAALQLDKIALISQLSRANQVLSAENRQLQEAAGSRGGEQPIIGESQALRRVLDQADRVGPTDTTVLVLGETGTGKELVARYLHRRSDRRERPFVAVNCGALADTLLESELFGHVKGAFTGADRNKRGLFQVADRGTLFLDEIGDVSTALQIKLLRVLQEGEVTPVGSGKTIAVDVRVICATHQGLERMVADGRFREDLFYRINVFPISVPALRERSGDVALLARCFLAAACQRLGRTISDIEPEALERLSQYRWPGNIRELQNEIQRAVVLADDGATLQTSALSERITGTTLMPRGVGPLREMMAKVEEQYVRRVLSEYDDNRTAAAKKLGISRQALTEKLKKYGVAKRYTKR